MSISAALLSPAVTTRHTAEPASVNFTPRILIA